MVNRLIPAHIAPVLSCAGVSGKKRTAGYNMQILAQLTIFPCQCWKWTIGWCFFLNGKLYRRRWLPRLTSKFVSTFGTQQPDDKWSLFIIHFYLEGPSSILQVVSCSLATVTVSYGICILSVDLWFQHDQVCFSPRAGHCSSGYTWILRRMILIVSLKDPFSKYFTVLVLDGLVVGGLVFHAEKRNAKGRSIWRNSGVALTTATWIW